MAFEKGFYLRRGLDVRILGGGPGKSVPEALRRGEAEFGTMFLTAALEALDKGTPLVHTAQIVNGSSLLLIGRANRGIRTPEDLRGLRVSLWGDAFHGAYLAFFRSLGVTVREVLQNWSVNLFLRGVVDACAAMDYNEYHMLLQAGMEPGDLSLFRLGDYGFGFPEDGLYCLASYREANPRACRDLVEATLEGWRYAAAHPEEALDVVMRYVREAHVPTNRAHMAWSSATFFRTSCLPRRGGSLASGGSLSRGFRADPGRSAPGEGYPKELSYEEFTEGASPRVP
jgi:NitT/TauT family transport system substrate-binding protein